MIYALDLIGTFAFAISGALLGVKKNMDIYGSFVLAFVTAIGGGTTRDVILGVRPFILRDGYYWLVILTAVLLVIIFERLIERVNKPLVITDAIGLGTFTVIGATKAIDMGVEWYGIIFMAVLTATGGGMIRDVLAGDVPVVLKREVYASAALLGAVVFYMGYISTLPNTILFFITTFVVVAVRLVTYFNNMHLPRKGA